MSLTSSNPLQTLGIHHATLHHNPGVEELYEAALRLGEDRTGMLMPWLDELVALSIDGGFGAHFYRMQHATQVVAIGRTSSRAAGIGCPHTTQMP